MSAPESQSTREPTDFASPGLSPDDCYMWDDECEYGVQADRPRGRLRFIGFDADEIKPNERPPFGCCLLIWGDPVSTMEPSS